MRHDNNLLLKNKPVKQDRFDSYVDKFIAKLFSSYISTIQIPYPGDYPSRTSSWIFCLSQNSIRCEAEIIGLNLSVFYAIVDMSAKVHTFSWRAWCLNHMIRLISIKSQPKKVVVVVVVDDDDDVVVFVVVLSQKTSIESLVQIR